MLAKICHENGLCEEFERRSIEDGIVEERDRFLRRRRRRRNRIFNYKRHRHVNFIFACTIACTRMLPRSLVIAIENLVSGSHCLAERMHISHVRYPAARASPPSCSRLAAC
mgnify:CR=1 FL=1